MKRDASPVDCSDYNSTISTVDRIISDCLYEGIPCDRPSALAAAYSVPDGAPIWFAADNLVAGTLPSDAVCARHESLRRGTSRAVRQYSRGYSRGSWSH